MQIGLLSPYNQKIVEGELKKGKVVPLGVELGSLLDEINRLEAETSYNLPAVLATLKLDCLQVLGKVAVEKEKEPKGGSEDGNKKPGHG